jgi:peptide/nickel transport system substrate-binding protein
MDQADALLTKDAYVLPLFQKPTFLAAYNNIVNLRDNATSFGPPYNVQAWGLTE